jgi:hypothetical protein
MQLKCLFRMAKCNAFNPSLFFTLTFAPSCRNCLTSLKFPLPSLDNSLKSCLSSGFLEI